MKSGDIDLVNDIYYKRDYAKLYTGDKSSLFHFEYREGESLFINLAIKSPIDKIGLSDCDEGYYDLETPYGYGGFYTNDFSVETPEATLSVRGTQGECSYSGDSGTSLDSGTGTWNVSSRGQQQTVQGTQSTDSKLTDADELAMQKRSTRMGDASGGITDAERKSLNRHGGTDRIFDPHVFDHVWRTGDCSSCGNP